VVQGEEVAPAESLPDARRLGARPEPIPEALPLEQLHHHVECAVVGPHVVEDASVGVVQGPGGERFLLEAL